MAPVAIDRRNWCLLAALRAGHRAEILIILSANGKVSLRAAMGAAEGRADLSSARHASVITGEEQFARGTPRAWLDLAERRELE